MERSRHSQALLDSKSLVLVFSTFVGMRCTEPGWRFNVLTLITCLMLFASQVTIIYTIYTNWPDTIHVLETVCCYGIVLPGFFKLIIGLRTYKTLRSFFEFHVEVFGANPAGRRAQLLFDCARRSQTVVRTLAVSFACSLLVFSVIPLYEIAVRQKRALFVSIYIPGVRRDHAAGYTVHMAVQLLFACYACAGNMSYDLWFGLTAANYAGLVAVLRCQLDRFRTLYERRRRRRRTGVAYRRAFLRNMMRQFNDANTYVNMVSGSYEFPVFMQIVCSSAAIVVSLFSIVAHQWYPGYGFVMYCFVQIGMLCYIGTIFVNEKERVCAMVYDQPWYTYDRHDRRIFLALLQMVMSSQEMWIGPLAPLNIDTGANITRGIFKYYTTMCSFLE